MIAIMLDLILAEYQILVMMSLKNFLVRYLGLQVDENISILSPFPIMLISNYQSLVTFFSLARYCSLPCFARVNHEATKYYL